MQVTLNTAQEVPWGPLVMDQGRPPRPIRTLPEGATLTYSSSNEDVASVEVLENGMDCVVHSDDVGTATITVTPGGIWSHLPPDTLDVTVINAAAGSLNMNLGAPRDEDESGR